MKKRTLPIFIAVLFLLGCETMHGVASHTDDRFPRNLNNECVVEAVKGVPSVEFVKSNATMDKAKTIFGEDIHRKIFVLNYKIRNLEVPSAGMGAIIVSEESSKDPSPSYNEVQYGNYFRGMNGPRFTPDQLEKAHAAIQAIDEDVWKKCELKVPPPTIHEN